MPEIFEIGRLSELPMSEKYLGSPATKSLSQIYVFEVYDGTFYAELISDTQRNS